MMNKVAMAVENDVNYRGIIRAQAAEPEATAADAISAATRQVAETLDLAAIVTYTSSGSTGIRAARERPSKPIIALSPNLRTTRRLSVVWGIHCIQTEDAVNLEDMVDRACVIAYQEGFARPGDRIAITAGIPLGHARRHQHAAHRLRAAGRGWVVVATNSQSVTFSPPWEKVDRREAPRRMRGGRTPGVQPMAPSSALRAPSPTEGRSVFQTENKD